MASAERRIARPRSSQCFVDEYHRVLNVWAQGREREQVQQALFTAGFRFYFKKQMGRVEIFTSFVSYSPFILPCRKNQFNIFSSYMSLL